MEHLTIPKYFPAPLSVFPSNGELPLEANPFADNLTDPLCKLSLKETSEFFKSFPATNNDTQMRRESMSSVVAQRRLLEAPSTPGRPVFGFSVGNRSRKGFPSKWDDAEKWLMSSSCHDSPAHARKPHPESSKSQRQFDNFKQQKEVFVEKSSFTEEKVSKVAPSFQYNSARACNGVSASTDVFLNDKFTDNAELVSPNVRYSEPSKEGFLFGNSAGEIMVDAHTEIIHEVQHRDVGTEMTPLGSSTTSRCHTPFKSSSPARHNTPASRSGPLALGNSTNSSSIIDVAMLQECHLAKLQLGNHYDSVASNWVSREEEEVEISKSLRHIEIGDAFRKNVSESRVAAWEEEDKTKCCLRFQREEAKIQAWVNLQNAKAEAQSRKLEVKIQKMKWKLEEKLMKRMADVHRKADEWRAAAQEQHTEQINRAGEQGQKMMNGHNSLVSGHSSCGCFPCKNYR